MNAKEQFQKMWENPSDLEQENQQQFREFIKNSVEVLPKEELVLFLALLKVHEMEDAIKEYEEKFKIKYCDYEYFIDKLILLFKGQTWDICVFSSPEFEKWQEADRIKKYLNNTYF